MTIGCVNLYTYTVNLHNVIAQLAVNLAKFIVNMPPTSWQAVKCMCSCQLIVDSPHVHNSCSLCTGTCTTLMENVSFLLYWTSTLYIPQDDTSPCVQPFTTAILYSNHANTCTHYCCMFSKNELLNTLRKWECILMECWWMLMEWILWDKWGQASHKSGIIHTPCTVERQGQEINT